MTDRKAIDWEGVEREYRAGVRSLRDIGAEFGVSHVSVKKRADKDGWVRDLSAKIQAAAEEKVTKAEVTKSVNAETKSTERELVEANAQMIADKVIGQRTDISRARAIVNKLFFEVEAECDHKEDFSRLGEIMRAPDAFGQDKLNDLYIATISLPQRVKSAKLLADALKVLIELERKVLRIKDDASLDDAAKKFGEGAAMSALEAYTRMCQGG